MREYGKVYTAFWSNEDMRAMSEDARMLAIYLMTCPHGNMVGCYRLPDAYAAEDLNWPLQRVSKGFVELFTNGFSYRCERSKWVFIRKYLEWNQFENPNVGKAAGKLFETLAAPDQIKALLINALRQFAPHFPIAIISQFDTLSIPFENPFALSSKTAVAVAVAAVTATATEAEITPLSGQSPNGEQGIPIIPERRAVVIDAIENEAPLAIVVAGVSKPRGDAGDDVRAVFTYWQKTLNHERAQLDAKRLKAIKARLKDGYSVADLCQAVDGCSRSAHHMGQNETRTVYDDIELICRDGPRVDAFIKKAGTPAGPQRSSAQQQTLDNLQAYLSRGNNGN